MDWQLVEDLRPTVHLDQIMTENCDFMINCQESISIQNWSCASERVGLIQENILLQRKFSNLKI